MNDRYDTLSDDTLDDDTDAQLDALLDAQVRSHDVAESRLSTDQVVRREALLEQILAGRPAIVRPEAGEPDAGQPRAIGAAVATDPGAGRLGATGPDAGRLGATGPDAGRSVATGPVPGRPADELARRRASRRLRVARWALPAAVAAGLAGVFAVTSGPADPAYASWTPQPTPVTGADLTTAENACRANLAESLRSMNEVPPEQRPTVDPQAVQTVVAERRGDFVFLSMADAAGSTSQCFFTAGDLSKVSGSTGGLATAAAPVPTGLQPGEVEAGGAGAGGGPEGDYGFTTGRVAPGTRAVTVRTGGQTIQASVSGEHFAAWWPQRLTGPGADPPLAFDVTLADGRVVTDARDILGAPPPDRAEIGAISTGGGVGSEGTVATVGGQAGAEVASVTIHVDGRTIEAPVTDQTSFAQWPADRPEVTGTPTFDVHLRDGTVLRAQEPVGR